MVYDESKGGWLASVSLYIAWFISAVGAIADGLYIREAILSLLSAFQVLHNEAYRRSGGVGIDLNTGFAISALDNFLILILGCAAIAAVVAIEYYFRKGRPKGLLWKRIGTVLGVEIGIIVVSIIIRLLASL